MELGSMHRAYSFVTIKSFDSERRVFTGTATTPEVDRVGDVVESLGARFSNPTPLHLYHDHSRPVGEVSFRPPTKHGLAFEARIFQIDEPGTVRERLNEAWHSVKLGLLKAVSIGFNPVLEATERMKSGGMRFREWEMLELSLVSVPANASATIATIKALDKQSLGERFLAATGTEGRSSRSLPGDTGTTKAQIVMNVSTQIASVETDLREKSARLAELITQQETDGGLPETEETELETVTKAVQSLNKRIVSLQALEGAQAAQAKAVAVFPSSRQHAESEKPKIEVVTQKLEKGTLFTRYAMAVAAGKGSMSDTLAYAKRWESQTPEVVAYIKAEAGTSVVQSPGWGGELVPSRTITSEFVELVRAATVLDKLNGLRRVPPRVNIQVQTGGSTFEWVGETGVKPVGELDFTTVPIGDHKVAGIVVISEELVKRSEPSAEDAVRRDLVAQCARFIDTQFLTPTVTAGANNPASITNGVASPAASGTDADALYLDLNTALATFDNADIGTSSVYLVTTPALARGISTLRNALGQFEFSGITMTGGTLVGLPVVVSSVVPSGHIFLIKADEIFLADEGRVRLDASNQATLDMAGGDTPTFNLWQRNCIGLRAEQFITWAKRRADAVAVIDTAAYGPTTG